VDALCREVFASSFEVYRSVWSLRCLDLVRTREREYPRPLPGEIPRQGRLESVGMPLLMLEICRAGETGVLRVWGPAGERTVHLKDGAVIFATSSDPNEGLVSYLLRRGVIGVKDRDEAARRLLSNKRIGTLLVERGSVTAAELEQYVREQVSQIVLALFAWESGEYAFEEGELPTLEEITLDGSVETLVLQGILRVERWPWIVDGLGDLRGTYRLRPDYLDCLDRTEIGPGEWDMISLLKEERSLRDLCRSSAFSDFQTARIVWALLLIGVLERVPEEELREREEQAAREREETEALAGAEPPSEEAAEALPEGSDAAEEERRAEEGGEEIPEAVEAEETEESEAVAEAVEAGETEESEAVAEAVEAGDETEPLAAAEPPGDEPFELADVTAGAPGSSVLFPEERAAAEPGEAADSGPAFELGEPGAASTDAAEEAAEADEGVVDFELVQDEEESEPEAREPEERPAEAEEIASPEEPSEEGEPMPTLELEEPAPAEVDLAATLKLDASAMAPADLPAATEDEPESSREIVEEAGVAAEEVAPPILAQEADALEESAGLQAVEALQPSETEMEEGTADETGESAAAVDSPGEDGEEAREEGDDLPQDHLDREIHRFNEKHRFLFDHLRAEIGAGARNFVSSCQRRAGDELISMFEGCSLGPEGEYDAASLRRNIFDQNIDAYPHVFERLLHTEFDMVRDLLPPDRLERIESGLREIDDRYRP
jgi:hypothetical protein